MLVAAIGVIGVGVLMVAAMVAAFAAFTLFVWHYGKWLILGGALVASVWIAAGALALV